MGATKMILPDIQNLKDERNKRINKVGIRELIIPIKILDLNNKIKNTVGNLSMYVSLEHELKGTNMSRFVEIVHEVLEEGVISTDIIKHILVRLREKMQAKDSYVKIRFDYFIKKESPVTKIKGYVNYKCYFEGKSINGKDKIFLRIITPYTSLCFTKGHKVLMGDFSYKNIEDVKQGDEVISIKKVKGKKQRQFTKSKVKHVFNSIKNNLSLVNINGNKLTCTEDHPFLMRELIDKDKGNYVWREIKDGKNRYVKYVGYEDVNVNEFDLGWLQGILDGDGWITKDKKQIGLASKDKDILDNFERILKKYNILCRTHTTNKNINGLGYDKNLIRKVVYKKDYIKIILDKLKNVKRNKSFKRGYLSGIVDAEGSKSKTTICIYNNDLKILNKVKKYLECIGIKWTEYLNYKKGTPVYKLPIHKKQYYFNKDLKVIFLSEVTKFLSLCPTVCKRKHMFKSLSSVKNNHQILSVIPLMKKERVYNMEIEDENYIINGYIVHNCPCSKEISKYGAHNQHSTADITIELKTTIKIEEIIKIVNKCASCEIFSLLKRLDEKYVTEKAYENPKFVEDMVRDISLELDKHLNKEINDYVIVINHQESIHNHYAVAILNAGRDLK